jgi:hypothetical protein
VKAWTDWEIMRRQVAISGRVVDEDNKPVAGAQVTGWEDLEERLDRTLARLDGLYYFLDLPEGRYTLSAIDPRSGKHDEKSTSFSKDREHNINLAQADFKLSA